MLVLPLCAQSAHSDLQEFCAVLDGATHQPEPTVGFVHPAKRNFLYLETEAAGDQQGFDIEHVAVRFYPRVDLARRRALVKLEPALCVMNAAQSHQIPGDAAEDT